MEDNMKKFVTFLTTGLLTVALSTTVFADTNSDVWYTGSRENDTTYNVSIETSGKTADGYIEIEFDKDVLSCEANDVVFVDAVDMESVNVEDGCVRISYLSEKAMPEGSIFTVSFEVDEAYADKEVSVTVSSVTHNEAGDVVTSGNVAQTEAETEETEETETEETETEDKDDKDDKDDKQDNSGNTNNSEQKDETSTVQTAEVKSVETGDSVFAVAGILVLIAGLMVVAFAVKKKNAK